MFYQCHHWPHCVSKLKAEYYCCEARVDLRFDHCVQLISLHSETQYQVLEAIALHCAVDLLLWVCHTFGGRRDDRIFLLRSIFWVTNGYFSKLQCRMKHKHLRTLNISFTNIYVFLHMLCDKVVSSHVWHSTDTLYFFLILVFLISFLLSFSLHLYYLSLKLLV